MLIFIYLNQKKIYSDLMFDSKEKNVFVFFSEVFVNIWF